MKLNLNYSKSYFEQKYKRYKIESWLRKQGYSNDKNLEYLIEDNLKVKVFKTVFLNNKDFKNNKLPIEFSTVEGDFIIKGCELISLEGCPEIVKGDFNCRNNKISSFVGGPKYVSGSYLAGFNENIRNTDGLPDIIGGKLELKFCNIEKLSPGMPNGIKELDLDYNPLKTLENLPSVAEKITIVGSDITSINIMDLLIKSFNIEDYFQGNISLSDIMLADLIIISNMEQKIYKKNYVPLKDKDFIDWIERKIYVEKKHNMQSIANLGKNMLGLGSLAIFTEDNLKESLENLRQEYDIKKIKEISIKTPSKIKKTKI